MKRDELIEKFTASRVNEGRISGKHSALIQKRQEAVTVARQALKTAEAELRRAHQDHRSESYSCEATTSRLEQALRSALPADAVEAVQRLTVAIDRAREIADPDKADVSRLHRLMALRTEAAELHLSPASALAIHVGKINSALNQRFEELVTA